MRLLIQLLSLAVLLGSDGGDRAVSAPVHLHTARKQALPKFPRCLPKRGKTPAQAVADGAEFSVVSLAATADLAQVTFTYHITPRTRSLWMGIQVFLHRNDIKSEERFLQAAPTTAKGGPMIFRLRQRIENRGAFTVMLPVGAYGAARLLIFEAPNGNSLDYSKLLYDSSKDKLSRLDLKFAVTSTSTRVKAPRLRLEEQPQVENNADGTYRVTFQGRIEMPETYHPDQNGFFVMTKGDGGFAQTWVSAESAQHSEMEGNPCLWMPFSLTLPGSKPGMLNAQFGLFKYSWGDALHWTYPGIDFETGGNLWVQKAPEHCIPPRLRVRHGRFVRSNGNTFDFYPGTAATARGVGFVRGGNFGNALTWSARPELNCPGFFAQLRGIGCRFMRVLFSPARYLSQSVYRNATDQVVQNIWAAGLYPVIAPQGMAAADTRREQVTQSLEVVRMLAEMYRGRSIWLEICNEPVEFGSWSEWKPIATEMVQTIRRIDPDAFVIVPLEGAGMDARAAAKDPIRETEVDLYDAHAYISPDEMTARFLPALRARLPLMVGEYGGGNPLYLGRMDRALQSLPGLMASGPWAFTKAGQDSLPLVEEGSPAPLRFTRNGRQIAADYRLWSQGLRKSK